MTDKRTHLLPVLIAAGSGLATTSAQALELGAVDVHSALGQPLRASIAYALAPQEQLAGYCVSVQSGAVGAQSNAITNVSIAAGTITVSGGASVREPLLSVRVAVNCPGAANLAREYTLFIDPARSADTEITPVEQEPIVTPVSAKRTAQSAVARPIAGKPASVVTPIANHSNYRVQPGDTLSSIARRITNRQAGVWQTVATLHAANPDAFIDNDPNRLLAGAVLSIPQANVELDSSSNAMAQEPAELRPVSAPLRTKTDNATRADVAAEASSPYTDSIHELQIRAEMRSTSANVPVAVPVSSSAITAADAATASAGGTERTSLWWLVGGGVVLLGSLLLFGRRLRDDENPSPSHADTANPLRRSTDSPGTSAVVAEDYDLNDDSPTAENPVLDVDLAIGSGLDARTNIHVVENLGHAGNDDLDLILPDDTGLDDELPETDIIAPPSMETDSILDSEILPDDDDYDMSVLMDVTKAPDIGEITERDLKAVLVSNEDDTLLDDPYTVSREVDFEVLEQDYEDELTATQALNLEIERAAAEFVARMDADDDSDFDRTEEIDARPKASVTELQPTARLKTG